jgi:hypothetical protein
VAVRADGDQQVFCVLFDLGGLDPEQVQVELYTDGRSGGAPGRSL